LGATTALISATGSLPGTKLNFGGTVPTAVTVVPVTENPGTPSTTPFQILGSTKIVDIKITGTFNGSATVCLDGSEDDHLYHYTGGQWVELPSRTYSKGQVCGVTTSFSPFTAAPVATVPSAPNSVTAQSTGSTTADVSFNYPDSDGGSPITSFTVTSAPGGITATSNSTTISVTGLTPGTAYTFTVKATNYVGSSVASSVSNSSTGVGAPTAPRTIVATTTGKRSATVSFTAPSSNGGSVVTSYTATSTPGGITKKLTQVGSGIFIFDALQPGTSYTFEITATNAIGTSAAGTSNSIKTDALVSASISSITFTDDGSGTAGKLTWVGSKIDSVLYTGPAGSYPGPFTFGAFSSSWNGSIRNLTPETSYTISIYAVSVDGIGESKSLTFKTGAKTDVVKNLAYWNTWLTANTYSNGEAARLFGLLTKFNSLETSPIRSFIKVPVSLASTVSATSLTPKSCSIVSTTAKVDAGMVKALTKDTCTISYTVSGPSKAPATLVKDFVFKKVG
jgi:hypothetical protein